MGLKSRKWWVSTTLKSGLQFGQRVDMEEVRSYITAEKKAGKQRPVLPLFARALDIAVKDTIKSFPEDKIVNVLVTEK